MNESNNKKIEYFINLCDDLITCKFLVAESKIQKLLACLADTAPIYELVSDCMEQFNHDREMNKAFVTDGKGRFYCNMPTEEYKIIALVFCTLADIDQKKIDFTDFIKRFFDDEDGVNCYTSFARRMILPFRELIAEAFGYPKRYSRNEDVEETAVVNKEDESIDSLFETCSNLAKDMVVEIDENKYYFYYQFKEFKLMLVEIIKACEEKDFSRLRALVFGAKYASKGIKCVKFLMKELTEEIEDYIADLEEDDED